MFGGERLVVHVGKELEDKDPLTPTLLHFPSADSLSSGIEFRLGRILKNLESVQQNYHMMAFFTMMCGIFLQATQTVASGLYLGGLRCNPSFSTIDARTKKSVVTSRMCVCVCVCEYKHIYVNMALALGSSAETPVSHFNADEDSRGRGLGGGHGLFMHCHGNK